MEDIDVSTSTSLSYPIAEEQSPEQAQIEEEQKQEDYSVAALIDHPGWKQIHDKMEADIKRIRSLSDVKMNEYTDKELGEVVRGEFRVANQLEKYLSSVSDAVEAIREK
jgi:predicted RNA-binding protein with PUA-like domain